MPTTRPAVSTSAPPELPGLIAASVWMKACASERVTRVRPSAEMIPLVTVYPTPKGLPKVEVALPHRRHRSPVAHRADRLRQHTDIHDEEADREHPNQCEQPGRLPLAFGFVPPTLITQYAPPRTRAAVVSTLARLVSPGMTSSPPTRTIELSMMSAAPSPAMVPRISITGSTSACRMRSLDGIDAG